jgi:uncharacterized membrane protein YjgN (DUF898 family)
MEENLPQLPPSDPTTDNLPLDQFNTNTFIPKAQTPTAASQAPSHSFAFHGHGGELFKIQLVNFLLRVVTFNFYYPWAKANKLKYLYENTEFSGSRFTFHGTGQEMFKGYLKLLGIGLILAGAIVYCNLNGYLFGTTIVYFLASLFLTPVAIHSTLRYRMSRTAYKGIFFGYRGSLSEMFQLYAVGMLLTVFSLGIYTPWFMAKLRHYVLNNIRLGNVELEYYGNGADLLVMVLKYIGLYIGTFILTFFILFVIIIITIGLDFSNPNLFNNGGPRPALIVVGILVYLIIILIVGLFMGMYRIENFNYHWNKTTLWQNQQEFNISSKTPTSEALKLVFTNYLLIIFTAGIGLAWAQVASFKFMFKYLSVNGLFDTNNLHQTESEYTNAAGEDLADFMDIDIA